MKKALLLLILLIFVQPQMFAAPKKMIPTSSNSENQLPNIFIYSLPEDENGNIKEEVTDTVYIEEKTEENSENEITLFSEEEGDSPVLGATTLKGYAQYVEDASIVHLKDKDNNYILNIKEPQKISASKSLNIKENYKQQKNVAQYTNAEYIIAPKSIKASEKAGDLTFGALYGNEVDNIAMLETETGLFTKYEKSRFALSSTFKKSLNTTYAQDYNTFSIAPELKLNNYISLKNVLSADITRRRNSSQLVFSLNPFGKKDNDRMLFELGAKQTTYQDTGFIKTEFSFSTTFKL